MNALTFWSRSEEGKELSNFFPCPVTVRLYGEDYTFQNAEAAYQAHKMLKGNLALFETLTGKQAKDIVRTFPQQPEWGELMKDAAMKRVLLAKFTQNDKLGDYLISTYPRKLIHWAPWDQYWGWSKEKQGSNWLGVMLMELRDELLHE